jgi:hypothetical protein
LTLKALAACSVEAGFNLALGALIMGILMHVKRNSISANLGHPFMKKLLTEI